MFAMDKVTPPSPSKTASAGTLRCPGCGAPCASDADRCRYCNSRLATVACSKCFGMVFKGSDFCPHCGSRVQDAIVSEPAGPCPRCGDRIHATRLADMDLCICDKCAGIWIEAARFEYICAVQERQEAVLVTKFPPMPPCTADQRRNYVKCPECATLMNRVNFARSSGIVIDVCTQHGIWLDRDELRQIVQYIQAGGLSRSRQLIAERIITPSTIDRSSATPIWHDDEDFGPDLQYLPLVIGVIAGILKFFVR
jgi:Zn-finger nucleic acid-binding protein